MTFVVAFLLKALVIFLVAKLLPGVRVANFGTAIIVALVYAGISMLLKGVLVFLALPMIVLTFGLFLLVINAFLLWITDKLFDDFEIKSLPILAVATVLITVGNMLVEQLVPRIL